MDSPRSVRFESFEIDLRTSELRKDGSPVQLQGQPMQILVMLVQRPGEMVTREELQKKLWPDDTFVEFDHSINAAVKRLRHTLGDSAENPRYIETLARRGYRFISPVEVIGTASEADSVANLLPVSSSPITKTNAKNYRLLAGTAFLAALAVLLGMNVGGWREKLRQHAAPHIDSLAVLPLENLSHDPDQEYFADAMTEALITNLGKIGALRVISRRSVMHFKNSKETLPQIARQLNVDAVVDGSVERSGNRIRVRVNLIHASPEKHLWGEEYDREMKDILLLESELAQAIAGEIKPRLTSEEHVRLSSAHPVNPEAYEAYIKGRFFLSKRSKVGFQKAVDYLKIAIDQDPRYAEPYASLAQCYALTEFYGALPFGDAWKEAKAAALKALALDETLSEAHAAYAIVLSHDWKWQEADKEFRRAIELNPNDTYARNFYINYLRWMSRGDEALKLAQANERLDPISPLMTATLGGSFFYLRRYDDAIVECRKAIELEPTFAAAHYDLGRAYELKGMIPQAVEEFERTIELFGRVPIFLGALGHSFAASGRRIRALQIIDELRQPAMRQQKPAFYIALIYSGLGENDSAFEWLEVVVKDHQGAAIGDLKSPIFDSLRSDARFADVLRRVGLPLIH